MLPYAAPIDLTGNVSKRQIQTPEVISAARILFNCKVDFGSGASVQSLITAFESRHVQLSNLSPSVTETDLMCFVSTFVDSAGIAIHRFSPQSLPSAIVEFDDSTQAANAIQLLDNQEFDSRRLSARLALEKHVAETGSGVLRSSRIKISWLEPRRSAFAFYSSASAADKHAKRLDGMVFQGHRIKTSYQRNKFPRPLKVGIHNLPDEPPISSLKAFCRALHVSLKDRDTSCAPIEVIRTVLQRFGGLESFEALPTSLDSQKASAFVSFSNADAATAATKELPNTPMDFMGGMPLLVHRDFSVKYKTRARIFFKIKAVIESFNDSLGAETRVRCHSVGPDRLPADPVTILINGSDPKTLGGAKAGLEKILKGELVQKDGKKLWDEYFDSPFGKAHIHQLNANAPFFIHYNSHNRTIRLFGDTDGKNRARDAIVSQLQHVQERRHILPLQRDIIRVLLDGGLKHLKEEIGKDKFILNAVARTLTVDGEEDEIARVRRAVAELQSSVVDQTSAVLPNDSNSDVLCPVCFCDVVDPIKLGCGHVYCLVCLQHYLRSGSDAHNFSPLRCVAEIRVDQTDTLPCSIDIPYNIVRRLLSSAEEDALLRASFLAYTSSHPEDLHYCPSNDCEMVYRTGESGSTVQCPSCLTRICTSCHVEVHEGMSCAEYKDNSNGGYEALQKWRLENGIKQCPRCHADIEKAGGCNHMKCAVCKTHICWVCMKTFGNQADNGGMIYDHMSRTHGGIGIEY